jgi:hypothetical protein
MIKAHELRFGNTVFNGFNQVVTIEGIISEKNTTGYDTETLKRIPLVEKRLYELGLKKYEDSEIPTYFKNFGNYDGEDFEYCFMIFQDVKGNFYTEVMGRKVILESVHQTQNLFFEVTGEQLIFKTK